MMTSAPFTIAEDQWFHIAAPGEWPHKPTGLTQILDDEAMSAILTSFNEAKTSPNWAGMLVDFDHQSLDQDKPTIAAGWITELDKRPNGLWARVRWSDVGQKSIEGGRYRFISPVWRSSDCCDCGDKRIRPMKLMNCAVTNDPNIRALFPLSNSSRDLPARYAPPAIPIPPPAIRIRMRGEFLFQNAIKLQRHDLLHNRAPVARQMTDEQLRAFFAKRGGGGSGGGGRGESGGSGPETGSHSETPGTNSGSIPSQNIPAPKTARDHDGRIKDLKDRRNQLLNMDVGPKPTKKTFDMVDVGEVKRAAMAEKGASAGDVIAAVNNAKATNKQRKAELKEIKDNIASQYKSEGARDRALARYLESIDKQFGAEVQAQNKLRSAIAEEVTKLDEMIAEEMTREQESENAIQMAEAERQRKEAVKAQVAADKAAEKKRQEAEKAAKNPPKDDAAVVAYRMEQRKKSAYIDAMVAGDDAYFAQIYPNADHEAVKARVAEIMSASPTSSDSKLVKSQLAELKKLPIPMKPTETL